MAEGRGGAAGTPAPAVDAPASAADLASPKVDDFENYDDYLVARAKHEIKIEQQQTTVRQAQTETQKAFAERLKKAAEDDPTVLDVYQDRNLPVSVPMAAVIMESEKGPEILKYLGNNREESARIARLTPIAAARELLRIESTIASTPVPRTSTDQPGHSCRFTISRPRQSPDGGFCQEEKCRAVRQAKIGDLNHAQYSLNTYHDHQRGIARSA